MPANTLLTDLELGYLTLGQSARRGRSRSPRNTGLQDIRIPNFGSNMCRNIKTLFNFEPPVTDEEIRAASLQFVRKVSGFNKPSKANEAAFLAAVDEIEAVSRNLLHSLETNAPPKNREEEAAKARARSAQRFPA
jgi:hypothetical protein